MKTSVLCSGVSALLLLPIEVWADKTETISPECREILHKEDGEAEAKQRCLDEYRTRTTSFEVVVTANRVEEPLSQVPASVAVVPAVEIERSQSMSIADALRDVPGVDVSDAGESGLKRIRIRGEDSKRVVILIDGQEFFDPRDVGTPLLLSPEMVERIEVLRGPAAVVYGSRAVGGVVNIITKKGGYHPLQGSASVAFDSSTRGFQEAASLFGEFHEFEYRVAFAGVDAGNRRSGHGEVDPSEYKNKASLAYLGRQFGDHHVAFNYQMFDGESDVYVEPEVRISPPFVDFQIEAPQRDREKYSVFYDYETDEGVLRNAHVDLFRQGSVRELNTFSRTIIDPVSKAIADTSILGYSNSMGFGGNAFVDFVLSEQVSLLVGTQVSTEDLEQTRDRTVSAFGAIRPTESVLDEASLDSAAGYARANWSFASDWELSLGGRFSRTESALESTTRVGLAPASSSDNAFVGSGALLFNGIDDVTLWMKAGQGYQYPSLNQSATGAFAGPSFVNPNFYLKPETSWEYEIGARLEDEALTASASVFYSDADEYIDHVLCSSTTAFCIQPTGARDRVYVNIDSAKTWGAEAEFRYVVEEWSPYLRGTWIRRQFDRTDYSTFDTGLAPFSGRIGVQYEKEINAQLGLWGDAYMRAESRAEEFDGAATESNPGWATFNIAGGLEFGPKHHYRFGVEFLNVFDKFYRAATENIPASGSAVLVRLSGRF